MAAQDGGGSATSTSVGPRRSAFIYSLIGGGALVVVLLVILVITLWPSGSSEPEFTLEISMAASSEGPAFESEFDCDDPTATSAFPHGAFAPRSLLVYPTELVGIRYRLVVPPNATASEFNFIGTWNTTDVEIEPTPICVALVEATLGVPQLEASYGTRNGDPAAELTVTGLEPGALIEFDMMLEILTLDDAGTLTVDVETNELVEVIGTTRRATIDLRGTAATEVALTSSTQLSAPGESLLHNIVVSNPSSDEFALDVNAVVDLPTSLGEHQVVEEGGFLCEVDDVVIICRADRLAPESSETISLSSVVTDTAPTSGASSGDECPTVLVFGREVAPDVCVSVAHSYRDDSRRGSSELRVATDLVPTLDLTLETDPELPFALPDEPLVFDYRLTGLDPAGLRSVEMFDSLCDDLTRVTPSPLEDGDELLEFNETWRFRCREEFPQPGARLALAVASRSTGARVEIEQAIDIQIVVPSLTVTVDAPPDPVITVINNGTSDLTSPAISAFECTSISYIDGDIEDDQVLGVGESWRFQCIGNADSFYAYALDPLGSVVTTFR